MCLNTFAKADTILSPMQKGFRAGLNGIHIQNFLLRTLFVCRGMSAKDAGESVESGEERSVNESRDEQD